MSRSARNSTAFVASGVFVLGVLALSLRGPELSGAIAEGSAARIRAAATAVVESLDPAQKKAALFDFTDKERFDWHFIPRERKGVIYGKLSGEQKEKVQALIEAALGKAGAEQARTVMAHEAILREIEGAERRFPRDPELYHVLFFGEPTATGRWGFRFEGHHLATNFFLDGAKVVSMTPLFFGANPASVPSGPKKGLRILAAMEDLAREIVSGLGEAERRDCLGEEGGKIPEELDAGPESKKYAGPFPRGLTADRLGAVDRRKLDALIAAYTRNLPEDLASELKAADAKEIHVAWRGGLKPFEAHSYLIHAPAFVIGYVNSQNGANHIHSILRTRRGEFALTE